mmetsp:Transcript_29753/g.48041  ORF Transcript_29753/g.48041 Transcript_29753/m.48041 type:complete len:169 (-) Transcript_29753:360-866(-)
MVSYVEIASLLRDMKDGFQAMACGCFQPPESFHMSLSVRELSSPVPFGEVYARRLQDDEIRHVRNRNNNLTFDRYIDPEYQPYWRTQEEFRTPPRGLFLAELRSFPTFRYQGPRTGYEKGDDTCSVCLSEYVFDDDLKTLPCLHVYHTDCIDEWLRSQPVCPTCKHHV